MSEKRLALEPIGLYPARALRHELDGTLYLGRRFEIYRSRDDGQNWSFVCRIPTSSPHRLIQSSRLACRLLRQEIRAMVATSTGAIIAANRAGVFHAPAGEEVMAPSQVVGDPAPYSPPMTITCDAQDRIIWGEYNARYQHGKPIRVYASRDAGRRFEVVHTFAADEIRHVHGIIADSSHQCFWVLTGDLDHESGIGRLSWDLSTFDWLVRGSQSVRAVDAFDLGDALLFAMDSGLERNHVVRVDKTSGSIERGQPIDSCCINACKCADNLFISTSVTRVPEHRMHPAALWRSRDGESWTKVLTAEKDRWHPARFQYGSIILPRGESKRQTLLLSGQSLHGLDGKAFLTQCKTED